MLQLREVFSQEHLGLPHSRLGLFQVHPFPAQEPGEIGQSEAQVAGIVGSRGAAVVDGFPVQGKSMPIICCRRPLIFLPSG